MKHLRFDKILALSIAGFLSLFSTATFANNGSTSTAITSSGIPLELDGFDAYIEQVRADWKVPGVAIVIVKDDQIMYTRGFGLRDMEKKLPMTPDTLLPIGSVTKSFTTAAIAQLVDEGKLDWNKPIRHYIPEFQLQDAFATEQATLIDLTTHRSGLPRHDLLWYLTPDMSRSELLGRLRYLQPSAAFRTQFQYNNLMYVTAAHVAEVASGKSWETLVEQRLFTPLQMKRSNFSVLQSQKDSNFAEPYELNSNSEIVPANFHQFSYMGPAGGINSSVNEMASWLRMQLNNGQYSGAPVVSSKSMEFLHQPQTISDSETMGMVVPAGYAPGWYVDAYRGALRVYHGGNISGFSALLTMLPEHRIGIIAISNMSHDLSLRPIVRTAMDRLLHLPTHDWNKETLAMNGGPGHHMMNMGMPEELKKVSNTIPSHALNNYAGIYRHPAYGDINIGLEKNILIVNNRGVKTRLKHWHYDRFIGDPSDDDIFTDQFLQFATDSTGKISVLQTSLETGVDDIIFVRQE